MANITIPDFDFASFYYPEILDALIQYKRRYVPEMTDETPYEPFIQLLRAFALVGHLNNTTLDLIANEAYLSSAKLVESVREHLKLIDYQLSPAVPSQTDLLFQLSAALSATTEVIPPGSLVATLGDSTSEPVFFEVEDAVSVGSTQHFDYVFALENGIYTDYTSESDPSSPSTWSPWASAAAGDMIYFGHSGIMWDKMWIDVITESANITGIYEFYGNHHHTVAPGSAATNGSFIIFDVNSLLGSTTRVGTTVRVTLNSTGAFEDVVSTYTTGNIITTAGTLGQTIVSTNADDYSLSLAWYELTDVVDASVNFSVDTEGTDGVSYTLPQSLTQNWQTVAVGDETFGTYTAYWVRYRIISASGPVNPDLHEITINSGNQYVLASGIQGRTQDDDPLGSSNGLANQSMDMSKDYFILNTETVVVDGDEWTRVDNFLSSLPTNKHYTVSLGDNDRATVTFGDGVTGAVPVIGVGNVACEYRYNAELDGNVGAGTIISDQTGLTQMNSVTNPRGAAGWSASEGSTEQSLEQAKIAGPASLRIKEVALNSSDVETMAVDYVDDDGTSPFTRSSAFEGTLGPKTIELVVVAAGGGDASITQLEAADSYFNGDTTSSPVKPKRIIANQELTTSNYTKKYINVEATVWGDVEAEAVQNALIQLLQPEAVDDDGVSYLWDFGGEIPVSRLVHEIFNLDSDITKVEIDTPSSDTTLNSRELPFYGTISITVES